MMFFNALWVAYFEELIAQMRAHRDSQDIAHAAFQRCGTQGQHTDQLSQYDRFDHLDVLSEDPDLELNPHVPPRNPSSDDIADGFPYAGHASTKRSRTLNVALPSTASCALDYSPRPRGQRPTAWDGTS